MPSGALGISPYASPLFGYFFCMIAMLTAVVVMLTGFSNISTSKQGRHHLRPPVIGRTVTAEAAPAKDVSLVVATAKRTKKGKHHKPKVLARQRDDYGYRNALGYAEESGYGPRGLFFR